MNIISVTLPIFLFVILGYIGKSFNLINDEIREFLSKVSYYFALPCLLFKGIVSFDFEKVFSPELVIHNLLVTFVVCLLSIAISLATVETFKRGAFAMSCFRSNQGYIGLPLALGFYGEQTMSKVAVTLGFSSPFVTVLSIVTLNLLRSTGEKSLTIKSTNLILSKIVDLLINPYILVTALGFFFSYNRIPIYEIDPLMNFLDMAGNIALPLALISIGYCLEFRYLRKNLPLVMGAAAVKLILMPFIAFLFGHYVFKLQGANLGVSVLLPATPTSVASYVMACQMDTDGELSAAAVGFSTLLSIITLYVVQSFMYLYI